MKKTILIPITLLTLISLVVFVSAAMTHNPEQSRNNVKIYDVSLQISKGWNFISFPAGLDFKLDGSSFADGELKYGYLYSILDNQYVPVYRDHVYTQDRELSPELEAYMNKYNPSSDLDWIRLSGSVFWIYSEKEGTITYEHGFIEDFYKFHDGVNVISTTPEVIQKILTSDFGDCNVEDIIQYDTSQEKWVDWDTSRELETGKAVVFIVYDECDLNRLDETEITPPSIPN